MYNCENNFLDNLDNRRLSHILQKKLFWFLSEKKNLFYHCLALKGQPVSTFFSLLEPIQKKITNEIEEACFYMLLKNTSHKKIIDDSNNIYEQNNFFRLIYYIDTSDGFTEVLLKDKIDHHQNRCVLIDNQLSTRDFNPIKSDFSLILKVLFKK
jgi:hypothetical protein